MTILVTGGAGYIGAHTIVRLLEEGFDVVSVDNYANSSRAAYSRIEQIVGRSPIAVEADVRDRAALQSIFDRHQVTAIIHFAGLKSVSESIALPLRYWEANLDGLFSVTSVAASNRVHDFVFSSSATVYGQAAPIPCEETWEHLEATNPYGQTKVVQERILTDLSRSDSRWRIALLRYFNPIGAHPSGLIGEDPQSLPSNLTPYITQVGIGKLDSLNIFGDDYPTRDGTAERDYLHVMDLADGHLAALTALKSRRTGIRAWNLGTGQPTSVLEVVASYERAMGKLIPKQMTSRRAGDLPAVYADVSRSEAELGWKASRTVDDAARDAWRWQTRNPDGYRS